MVSATRRLPAPTPETVHFWEGTRSGELRLQRCMACEQAYFPPRPFCPSCGSRDVAVFAASGRAALHSYTISYRPAPGFVAPYVIAVIELEEGPRMMTNIVGCPPDPRNLPLDMPLTVVFEAMNDEITLPFFGPVGEQQR